MRLKFNIFLIVVLLLLSCTKKAPSAVDSAQPATVAAPTPPPPVTLVAITLFPPSATVVMGMPQQYEVIGIFSDGHQGSLSDGYTTPINWKFSHPVTTTDNVTQGAESAGVKTIAGVQSGGPAKINIQPTTVGAGDTQVVTITASARFCPTCPELSAYGSLSVVNNAKIKTLTIRKLDDLPQTQTASNQVTTFPTLIPGKPLKLVAEGLLSNTLDGTSSINLTNNAKWSTDNAEVAVVNGYVIFTPTTTDIKLGRTVTVTASVLDLNATMTLSLGSPVPVSIQITANHPNVEAGKSVILSALILNSDGSTSTPPSGFEFSVDAVNVAEVGKASPCSALQLPTPPSTTPPSICALLTTKTSGIVNVSYSVTMNYSDHSIDLKGNIAISIYPKEISNELNSIKLSVEDKPPETYPLRLGDQIQLKVTPEYRNNNNSFPQELTNYSTWTITSNIEEQNIYKPSITSTGIVKSPTYTENFDLKSTGIYNLIKSNNQAVYTVTASYAGKSATATIKLALPRLVSVTLSPENFLVTAGRTIDNYAATAFFADGHQVQISPLRIDDPPTPPNPPNLHTIIPLNDNQMPTYLNWQQKSIENTKDGKTSLATYQSGKPTNSYVTASDITESQTATIEFSCLNESGVRVKGDTSLTIIPPPSMSPKDQSDYLNSFEAVVWSRTKGTSLESYYNDDGSSKGTPPPSFDVDDSLTFGLIKQTVGGPKSEKPIKSADFNAVSGAGILTSSIYRVQTYPANSGVFTTQDQIFRINSDFTGGNLLLNLFVKNKDSSSVSSILSFNVTPKKIVKTEIIAFNVVPEKNSVLLSNVSQDVKINPTQSFQWTSSTNKSPINFSAITFCDVSPSNAGKCDQGADKTDFNDRFGKITINGTDKSTAGPVTITYYHLMNDNVTYISSVVTLLLQELTPASVTLSASSGTIQQGVSTTINYTVKDVAGNVITNSISEGVVSISPPGAATATSPTSGTFSITPSPSNFVSPITVTLSFSGKDGKVVTGTLALNVAPQEDFTNVVMTAKNTTIIQGDSQLQPDDISVKIYGKGSFSSGINIPADLRDSVIFISQPSFFTFEKATGVIKVADEYLDTSSLPKKINTRYSGPVLISLSIKRKDGTSVSGSLQFNVVPALSPDYVSVSVTALNTTIPQGGNTQLTIQAVNTSGELIPYSTILSTKKQIQINPSVGNSSVDVTIDTNNLVSVPSSAAVGLVNILVSVKRNDGTFIFGELLLNVVSTAPSSNSKILLVSAAKSPLIAGTSVLDSTTLIVSVKDTNSVAAPIQLNAPYNNLFSSSPSVSVDNNTGIITANSIGAATVTVSVKQPDGTLLTGNVVVNVSPFLADTSGNYVALAGILSNTGGLTPGASATLTVKAQLKGGFLTDIKPKTCDTQATNCLKVPTTDTNGVVSITPITPASQTQTQYSITGLKLGVMTLLIEYVNQDNTYVYTEVPITVSPTQVVVPDVPVNTVGVVITASCDSYSCNYTAKLAKSNGTFETPTNGWTWTVSSINTNTITVNTSSSSSNTRINSDTATVTSNTCSSGSTCNYTFGSSFRGTISVTATHSGFSGTYTDSH